MATLRRYALLAAATCTLAACGSDPAPSETAPEQRDPAPMTSPNEPNDAAEATVTGAAASASANTTEATPTESEAPGSSASPPTTTSSAGAATTDTASGGSTMGTAPESSAPALPDGPADGCRRLDDFEDLDDGFSNWFIVNDGVMGGRSEGGGGIADSVLTFTGNVVTDGGGFTSVRLRLDGGELAGSERIRLRLRADDRTYGLTYEDDQTYNGRSISHRADLTIPQSASSESASSEPAGSSSESDDDFVIVELAHSALQATVFGRAVPAEPFNPDAAREIGIIIADEVDGPFRLEIDWIDACS